MPENATAVIIAGGKSSRMLQDKALLPFGGFSSLAQFQYERLNKLFSKVYISSKEDKFTFHIEMIEDVNQVSSPLVALVSIFETLEINEVFVLSVDAPFVDEGVIKKLYEARTSTADVTVAVSAHGLEPLCAIYNRSFVAKAKIAVEKNQHRLQTLFDDLEIKKVVFEEEEKFMNLNYPKEYAEAKILIYKR
ncbi:MAG: Molybdenum cofactor guanylyltransferase [uncultured Sulfurovum sp.]|uniref:Probable molybdenum cofactor guanylyltransferase n=1 Tax=uncultured Sulfurovum sp. TaxID=269237 RepID=A0A6S6U3A3_9BACT|nr:MAG: Molybdenum cofactor guanylyltransferase [uncultured Sulfurovum sp.]